MHSALCCPPSVDVMGIPILSSTPSGLLHCFDQAIADWRDAPDAGTTLTVGYANAHTCNLFIEHEGFREALLRVSLIYLDGNGPRIAAWLAGRSLHPRMTAPDWLDQFCSFCVDGNFGLFLLGAREGVAAAAAEKLQSRHPSLRVLGTHHGYFDERGSDDIIRTINALAPDVLILAMASPRQECWMTSHRDQLQVPVIWGSGGTLDYISGFKARPPLWMRKLGLEWLGRLALEPRRLGWRYLVGLPKFALYSIRFAIRSRLAGRLA